MSEWKETSRGLLAKAWECADESSKVAAESSGLNPLASYGIQEAQFLALVAIYKSMDEMFKGSTPCPTIAALDE